MAVPLDGHGGSIPAPCVSLAAKPWVLYLLECANGALYAGITNDLEARFKAHQSGKGAKFTRANPPLRIAASCSFPDRSSASRAEWEVKQLPRSRKMSYIASQAAAGTTTELSNPSEKTMTTPMPQSLIDALLTHANGIMSLVIANEQLRQPAFAEMREELDKMAGKLTALQMDVAMLEGDVSGGVERPVSRG